MTRDHFDPDGDRLSLADLGRLEYALKQRMIERMGAMQSKRANNMDGLNVGSAGSYVEEARTLRRLLNKRGRQSYVPLAQMHGGAEWVNNDRADRAGIDRSDPFLTVVRKLHRDGVVPVDRRPTHTTHSNVPGGPADD